MIRQCSVDDVEAIRAVINDAARAYRGVIPEDRWKEPYMSASEIRHEMAAAVVFWGYVETDGLVGVMGIQPLQGVTLIRHAYVCAARQRGGIGGRLLSSLRAKTAHPVLVGTWAAASWAIRFYEKHGFRLVSPRQKDLLLRAFWTVPERQIETSVVLADRQWFEKADQRFL